MSEHTPIVFIVDDDTDIRDSVSLLVQSVGLSCETFADGQALLDGLPPDAHGCVVADIRMPGMSGLDLQARLAELGSHLPIIIMTGFGDVPIAVRAMKQGAVDFIEKPYQPDELLERIQQAIAEDAKRLSTASAQIALRERVATLTKREREVMDLVVKGSANKVVAIDLGISERTVEIHRSRVMKKMGARSLAELVNLVTALD